MIRISLPWMIDLASKLNELDKVQAGKTVGDCLLELYDAKIGLEALFEQSVYAYYLRSSREKGAELSARLDSILNDLENLEKGITEADSIVLRGARDRFNLVFLSEISTLPSFLVSAKASYDVGQLIDNGVLLFPSSLLAKVPEAHADAMEAGKALAFELSTACGFHAFRVTESVVRRYWDNESNGSSRPKLETLGNFAAEMEKQSFGDTKIIECIKQMTRLHRNPLIHPEAILSVEEAIGILGIARSITGMILGTLPDVLSTGSTPTTTP